MAQIGLLDFVTEWVSAGDGAAEQQKDTKQEFHNPAYARVCRTSHNSNMIYCIAHTHTQEQGNKQQRGNKKNNRERTYNCMCLRADSTNRKQTMTPCNRLTYHVPFEMVTKQRSCDKTAEQALLSLWIYQPEWGWGGRHLV